MRKSFAREAPSVESLTLWAARELLRGRTAPLAWSSALWYAHGLFRDYALPTRES